MPRRLLLLTELLLPAAPTQRHGTDSASVLSIQTQYRPIWHGEIGLYWVSNTDQYELASPVMFLGNTDFLIEWGTCVLRGRLADTA